MWLPLAAEACAIGKAGMLRLSDVDSGGAVRRLLMNEDI